MILIIIILYLIIFCFHLYFLLDFFFRKIQQIQIYLLFYLF